MSWIGAYQVETLIVECVSTLKKLDDLILAVSNADTAEKVTKLLKTLWIVSDSTSSAEVVFSKYRTNYKN